MKLSTSGKMFFFGMFLYILGCISEVFLRRRPVRGRVNKNR